MPRAWPLLCFTLAYWRPVAAPPPPLVSPQRLCLTSAGYTWCGTTQSCERQWEIPCADNYRTCEDCLQRQREGINIACPEVCDRVSTGDVDPCHCEPPHACAPPPPGCTGADPVLDECGCFTACPEVTCGQGATCGGFALDASTCTPPFECVTRAGPYVADAPGTCEPPCALHRDAMGNCIEPGCTLWFDGCNTCHVTHENGVTACTGQWCTRPGAPTCMDNGKPAASGAVCHRFCEDGSEPPVHAKCMDGLACVAPAGAHTDSCGPAASRCASAGH